MTDPNKNNPPLKQQLEEAERELAATKKQLEKCEEVLTAKQEEIRRLQQQQ